jgi:Glutathione S-transferase
MALKFYASDLCPFCRPVKYFLKANSIPHQFQAIDLLAGKHRTEEYKKINPFQKVPTIIDDDFVIFESSTLLKYLANSQKTDEFWYPKNPKQRALVDLFFDWYGANVGNINKYNAFKLGFVKNVTQEEAKQISDNALKELENVFLSQRKFISSHEKLTIADVAVAFHFAGSKDSGYEFSPRLEEYIKNVYDQDPALKEDIDSYIKLRREWLDSRENSDVKVKP